MFGRQAAAGTSQTLLSEALWRRIACESLAVILTKKIPASMGTTSWLTCGGQGCLQERNMRPCDPLLAGGGSLDY